MPRKKTISLARVKREQFELFELILTQKSIVTDLLNDMQSGAQKVSASLLKESTSCLKTISATLANIAADLENEDVIDEEGDRQNARNDQMLAEFMQEHGDVGGEMQTDASDPRDKTEFKVDAFEVRKQAANSVPREGED